MRKSGKFIPKATSNGFAVLRETHIASATESNFENPFLRNSFNPFSDIKASNEENALLRTNLMAAADTEVPKEIPNSLSLHPKTGSENDLEAKPVISDPPSVIVSTSDSLPQVSVRQITNPEVDRSKSTNIKEFGSNVMMNKINKSVAAGDERLFSAGHHDSMRVLADESVITEEPVAESNVPQTVDLKIFEQLQKGISAD